MKLSYFELLSKDPIYLPNAGGILSPTLKEISALGIHTYHYYLTVLLMDDFDLFLSSDASSALLQDALNFFIREDVICSLQNKCFFVRQNNEIPSGYPFMCQNAHKNNEITGTITRESFPQICDVIFQRNNIKSTRNEDPSKIENKKASEIMKKLQKGRAQKAAQTKADTNMELGNIISAVAGKSPSLNLLNIWDLTVFQLWDCFARLSNNSIYDIQSMSVAAWGDKDHSFDAAAWFKRIYSEN